MIFENGIYVGKLSFIFLQFVISFLELYMLRNLVFFKNFNFDYYDIVIFFKKKNNGDK